MRRILTLIIAVVLIPAAAQGWGAHGHRTITSLALDGLPADAPAFLRDSAVRLRIAEQANEPDRWRGTELPALRHANEADHYLDVELLEQFGLTLQTVPPLRNDYLRALIIAKHVHPENVAPYDRTKDPAATQEWPGFAAHAMAEHYAKLRSSFNTLRILEALDDPARAHQVELARQNIAYEMGVLSHYVGDAAQPLHTTEHHHGWVGANPNGYTTDRKIHAYIDSEILGVHGLGYEALRGSVSFERRVNGADPWEDIIRHVERSFAQVEPLYRLEKAGTLTGPEGKALIAERLCDGASMLAALYRAAWETSVPTEQEIYAFKRYNAFNPALLPGGGGGAGGEAPRPEAPGPAPAVPDAAPSRRPRRSAGRNRASLGA